MPTLTGKGLLHVRDHEHVEDRAGEQHDRRHQPEEQEGDVRRVAAIARHGQLVAGGLLGQPFAEIEVFHHPRDQLLRCLPQRDLLALVQAIALTLPDTLALAGDRLHALGEAFAGEQRHHQRIGRRAGGDGS
jgi:hypothetical protein